MEEMQTGSRPLFGVNLGGWLVLERWITPSLFGDSAAKDEYSFMQESDAAEKIKWHRRTFITESDFRWLASKGVDAVRVPVGYWLFDGDGPFTACVSYLDWAFEMAEKHGLKILVDLHAVKGSQNGNDHSGRIGKIGWYKNKTYQQQTIEVLKRISKRYKNSPALWGVELLNEPKLSVCRYFALRRFYNQAYCELTAILQPDAHIVFSDAFAPRLFSGSIRRTSSTLPVMDVHWYQFGRTSLAKYFKKLAERPHEVARLQRRQPVIIGEWSGMLSHMTLEGRVETEQALLQRRHIEKQLEVYGTALGWFYWTYKTEDGGIWSFREQVESGNLRVGE